VLLTCRDCNHFSGAQLDAHICTGAGIKDAFAGRAAIRGQYVSPGGIKLNVDLRLPGEGGGEITILADKNHPDRLLEAQAEMAAKTWGPGTEMRLLMKFRYVERTEQIAWLRVGYLYAFAALGYRFLLGRRFDALEAVRRQLSNPTDRILPVEDLVARPTSPVTPCIAGVKEPEAFRESVVVATGERLILLPASLAFLESPPARREGGITLECWPPLTLPQSPEHLWDEPRAAT
jgi:hypothetical protein